MKIRLTISNLCARAAMLLLVIVISMDTWAHDYSIYSTTIEGVYSKMLKGNQQNYEINYKVKYDENTYLEEGVHYTVRVTFSNGESVNDGSIKPDGKNKLIVSMDKDKKYTLVNYILTIISTDYPTDTQTASFSVVRFEGDSPFIVSDSKNGLNLNLLAECVKNGITFEGESFKLGKDLNYEDIEYIPIGGYYNEEKPFKGSFDGCGHTIKGVNINSSTDDIGLFGLIGNGGEVKNLTLDYSNITGKNFVGGIVGYNQGGTITNCHVTSSVTIKTTDNNNERFGGIVGNNGNFTYNNGTQDVTIHGSVSYCTSAVTISNAKKEIGGIAGYNESNCILSHNLVINSAIPSGGNHGAIVGYNEASGILENNYYNGCKVDGSLVKSTIGIGYQESQDAESQDVIGKAEPLTSNNFPTIMLYDNGSEARGNPSTISDYLDKGSCNVVLVGRTLYKDGAWNTLSLPFNLDISGSVLDGNEENKVTVTVMALDTKTGSYEHITGVEDGTLYLNFKPITTILAGIPCIIKWSMPQNYVGHESDYDIINPIFSDVKITSYSATEVKSEDKDVCGNVSFKGSFDPIDIYTTNNDNKKILLIGKNASGKSVLYYPNKAMTIGAFRAYFQLNNGLTFDDPTNPNNVRAYSLNFDDDPTGIITTDYITDKAGAWYSLDGRKYNAKPTAKGLYIHHGKKIVIK